MSPGRCKQIIEEAILLLQKEAMIEWVKEVLVMLDGSGWIGEICRKQNQ